MKQLPFLQNTSADIFRRLLQRGELVKYQKGQVMWQPPSGKGPLNPPACPITCFSSAVIAHPPPPRPHPPRGPMLPLSRLPVCYCLRSPTLRIPPVAHRHIHIIKYGILFVSRACFTSVSTSHVACTCLHMQVFYQDLQGMWMPSIPNLIRVKELCDRVFRQQETVVPCVLSSLIYLRLNGSWHVNASKRPQLSDISLTVSLLKHRASKHAEFG